MAAVSLTYEDITPFVPDIDRARCEATISDALALAALVAPCITAADFASPEAARAILRGAVVRCAESGSGAVQQQTAGPFAQTIDTRQQRRGMFWPSEIEQLQSLCADPSASAAAYSIDTIGTAVNHMPWCALAFGAAYCSCGSDLTRYEYPLYEGGALSPGA